MTKETKFTGYKKKKSVHWVDSLSCSSQHMKFFLLAIKINDDLRTRICAAIKKEGHLAIECCDDADYIVTSLRSPERIARHVKHTIPVVHMDWILKETMQQNELAKHIINIHIKKRKIKEEEEDGQDDKIRAQKEQKQEQPPNKKHSDTIELSSSEDEEEGQPASTTSAETIPRQVRSWDMLQDTYSKHGCKITPRMVVTGHRPPPKLIKGESYQTTTTNASTSQENWSDFNFTTDGDTTDGEDDNDGDNSNSSVSVVADDDYAEKLGVYACQRPCDWNPFNKGIVEILEFLEYARELQGDKMNSRSYRIAASVIRAHPKKIKSAKQAKKLPGIGEKTGRIISDFLRNGSVQDVELLKADPEFQVLETFYNVHGAGSYTAREWYRKGHRTLSDVLAHEKLSRDQEIGIRYYHDFKKKIPRAEVEKIARTISEILKEHFYGATLTVCGSYRRGKPESGDVDIIMTHKENPVSSMLLVGLLEILKSKNLLVEIISMGSDCQLRDGDDEHLRSDQALCIWRQPGSSICRRVDFVVSPYENYPVAVLAWTGSSHFERSIRLYAKKVMDIKVTSHGLYSRATEKRLSVESEQHAFEILNLKWLEPTQRNC